MKNKDGHDIGEGECPARCGIACDWISGPWWECTELKRIHWKYGKLIQENLKYKKNEEDLEKLVESLKDFAIGCENCPHAKEIEKLVKNV